MASLHECQSARKERGLRPCCTCLQDAAPASSVRCPHRISCQVGRKVPASGKGKQTPKAIQNGVAVWHSQLVSTCGLAPAHFGAASQDRNLPDGIQWPPVPATRVPADRWLGSAFTYPERMLYGHGPAWASCDIVSHMQCGMLSGGLGCFEYRYSGWPTILGLRLSPSLSVWLRSKTSLQTNPANHAKHIVRGICPFDEAMWLVQH